MVLAVVVRKLTDGRSGMRDSRARVQRCWLDRVHAARHVPVPHGALHRDDDTGEAPYHGVVATTMCELARRRAHASLPRAGMPRLQASVIPLAVSGVVARKFLRSPL